ncbi:MAG: hypothetical protein AB8B65_15605 [Kordia sp.]|uniref:hypothetical protein n=1 Tax=Kordia sp. TaxID=1965332 RepID=UPI00385B5174
MIFKLIILGIFFLWGKRIWKKKAELTRFNLVLNVTLFSFIFIYLTYQTRMLPGSEAISNRLYAQELTGNQFWVTESFKNISERAFNGDGYSIYIYDISEDVANSFLTPSPDFFTKFPKSDRDEWTKVKWRKSPIKESENKIVDFAIWSRSTLAESNMLEENKLIRKILAEKGNYYAYAVNIESRGVFNVDFYILSPKEKKLICINHNT